MSLSKDTDVVYKYNVLPPRMSHDDFDESFFKFIEDAEALKADFDWKGNEIMVATYFRSGTHMAWYLIRYLLQGSTETLPDIMYESYYPPYFRPEGSPQTGPRRVMSCHILPCQYASDSLFKTGNRKFVYVIRNPNDVAVSVYNFWKEWKGVNCLPDTFSEFYKRFITNKARTYPFTGLLNHVKAWEEYAATNPDAPIIFIMFEDLVRKPRETLSKLADFLEIEVTDKLLDDVAEASKFSNMKKNKVDPVTEDHMTGDGNATMYRKGVIGDWKNWLTVENYEFFQKEFSKQSMDMACKDKFIFI